MMLEKKTGKAAVSALGSTSSIPAGSDVAKSSGTLEEKQQTTSFSSIPFDAEQHDPFEYISPSTLKYTGDAVIPITSKLEIVKPQDDTPSGIWPVFRLMVRRTVVEDVSVEAY